MNAAEALEASILHWQENVAAETPNQVNYGPWSCALCGIFWLRANCEGCPVCKKTGERNCEKSPYYAAVEALNKWKLTPTPKNAAAWRKAAQAELDFLISLREPKP